MSRIRTNVITNRLANGAPTVSNGLVISGVTTTSDIKVGTGVTLNVYGGATFSGIVTASSYRGDGSQLTGISVDTTKIETGNTKVETIDTGSDGHIKVTTEGTERLRIHSDGKIDIGLAGGTPDGLLEVYNSSTSGNTVLKVHNDKTGDAAQLCLEGKRTSDNDTAQILFRNNNYGVAGIFAYAGGSGNHDGGYLRFFTSPVGSSNALTERLRIGSAGQLGIAGANYGTSGQVLTSQGASSPIQWATLTTGKVLQFVYTKDGVTTSSNSGGWTDSVESGLNVDITPISATSKILVFMQSVGGNTSSGRSYFLRMRRKVNNTGDTGVASAQLGDGSNGGIQSISMTYVDYDASSPFNTSHVRNYRIRFGQDGSGTARFDYATQSYIYAMEIA